jgi:hypothetical protein
LKKNLEALMCKNQKNCRAVEEAFLDLLRQDAAQMMRLRHPGVVRVVQALDESKTTMAIVTEPIFASVANVLGSVDNVAKVPAELKDLVCALHPSILFFTSLLLFPESFSFLIEDVCVMMCTNFMHHILLHPNWSFAHQQICEGFDPSSLLHVK